jgi:hypothetical protein
VPDLSTSPRSQGIDEDGDSYTQPADDGIEGDELLWGDVFDDAEDSMESNGSEGDEEPPIVDVSHMK